MIIREQGDQLLLIRQTDHAFLAGFFAKEWGNEEFPRPEPFESFCLAVAEHDNGWSEWEVRPTLDAKTRQPHTFMSIPTEEHIALYQKGIERLVKADHYAALLVSMHCTGLYDRARATIPGYSAKYVKSTETTLVADFVQRLRLQQLRLKVDLRAAEATKNWVVEGALKANFERLEALDRLSLHLCLNPQEDCTIDAVPQDTLGNEVDLDLRSEGDNVLTMAPYPFKREALEVSILARRIPKRIYVDELDFEKTLAQAQYFGIKFTVRARKTNVFSRVANL
ncbi:MAG: DUF3891 family protein [Acidobacteria bacterium]|nr:DUF3891 family protein [Acidobacteriota bacterium]MBS1864840.1 DUF3891 family protein [Acidobacteriota bacterium]